MDREALALLIRRIGGISTGSVLLWFAFTLWRDGSIATHRWVAVAALALHAGGLALLTASATPAARWRWWEWVLGAAALLGLTTTFAAHVTVASRVYSTDSLAMMHESAVLLLSGHNPYTSVNALAEAAERHGLPATYVTFTVRGEPVPRIATYPALHILTFVPFVWLEIQDLRWVVFFFEVGTLVLLWAWAPSLLRPLVLLPLFINSDLLFGFAAGGVTDWLWVLPVVATVMALARHRFGLAAILYGLALSTKQEPWFLGPFLLIWVWKVVAGQRQGGVVRRADGLRAALSFVGGAGGIFLLTNGPFILWDFSEWFAGSFQPLVSPMVMFGQGLSLLTQLGIVNLPRGGYLFLTFAVWVALLVLYARRFAALQHAVWMFAAIPLWFSPRSLQNYFVFWIPVLLAGLTAWWRASSLADPVVVRESPASLGGPWRRGWWVSVVGGVLAVAVFLWARLGAASFEVSNISFADPLEAGAVTAVTAEVINHGPGFVEPRFSLQWHGFSFVWNIGEGPARLEPGARARYRLRPPAADAVPKGPLAGPREGDRAYSSGLFVVKVHDARTGALAFSRPVEAPVPRPPVLNPAFGLWTTPHPATLAAGPFRWTVVRRGDQTESRLERAEVQGVRGVALRVSQEGERDHVEAGLLQHMPFPRCGLNVRVLRTTPLYEDRDGFPRLAFGVVVEDGHHPRLTYEFAARDRAGMTERRDGSVAVVLGTPEGTWVSRTLDLPQTYAALGWEMPETATVTVSLLAAKNAVGTHVGYVSSLEARDRACPARES